MSKFSENIRTLRKSRHLTQAQLAERLGVAKSTVSMWENGQRVPEYDLAEITADFFHVDLMYLLGHRDVVEQLTGTDADDPAEIAARVSEHELALLTAYRLTSGDTRSAVDRILRVEE